jgi:hypothetical protein
LNNKGYFLLEMSASLLLLTAGCSSFVVLIGFLHSEFYLMEAEREAGQLLLELIQEDASVTGLFQGEAASFSGSVRYLENGKEYCLKAEGEFRRQPAVCLPGYD